MTTFDPARRDFEPYGFTCVRWTASLMPRPDRHNEVELNLLERGSVTYLLGGDKLVVPGRRLAVFWAAVPHRVIEVENVTEYFVLTLPLSWFLELRLPDVLVGPVIHGRIVLEPAEGNFAADVVRFHNWLRDLSEAGEEPQRICLLEIEARLRRLALELGRLDPGGPPEQRAGAVLGTGGLNRAERMAAHIARHYMEPLTIEGIARAVDLHPNYAMSLFQRVFGTSLLKHVTQHRLVHAQRLLVTSDRLVLDIALSSGFGSLSRFNEAFKAAFGCTPREYRRQHR